MPARGPDQPHDPDLLATVEDRQAHRVSDQGSRAHEHDDGNDQHANAEDAGHREEPVQQVRDVGRGEPPELVHQRRVGPLDLGPDAFYTGPIARELTAEMVRGKGLISAKDLSNYRAIERRPLLLIGLPGLAAVGIGLTYGLLLLRIYQQSHVFILAYALLAMGGTLLGAFSVLVAVVLFALSDQVRRITNAWSQRGPILGQSKRYGPKASSESVTRFLTLEDEMRDS